MDCETAWALVSAEMDQAIEGNARALLDAHLQECAACRTVAAAWRSQDADLRRTFSPRRQAVALNAQRTIACLRAVPNRSKRRLSVLPMVAAAAAGFLLAVLLFRPWQERIVVLPTQVETQPGPGPEAPAQEMLTLAIANRNVEVQTPDQQWRTAAVGENLPLGTHVRTGPTVRCEFRTADGSEIRLNGGTEMVFVSSRRLNLNKGQILAQVAKAAVAFQVGVPEATVTALGTEFDLQCKP